MEHAFECLELCKRCQGSGSVGRGQRERLCKSCLGSGSCHEWRGPNPPSAPCRRPECCICGKAPCFEPWCRECCRVDPQGELVYNREPTTWACTNGCCPKCGSDYGEWHSFPGETSPGRWPKGWLTAPSAARHEKELKRTLEGSVPVDVYLAREIRARVNPRPFPLGTIRIRPR